MNYIEVGLMKFCKVCVDFMRMVIIFDDYMFVKLDFFGRRIVYGIVGDCFLMYFGGNCRRGYFKIDFICIGLCLKLFIEW